MQSGLSRLEQELASQSSRSHQEVMNAFGVMGQNRLNDSIAITKIRNELLELMVRARLALPPNKNMSATVPRLRTALSLSEACLKLEQAAPLNWKTYIECLDRGTASYELFPPGSCSTETHPQAELFRAFLRPYLRGQVLDIGCGPQPVPSYLRDHPLSQISGIDPISAPSDHPFSFVPGYGEFLPWENEQFDVAVSGTSLDHYYLLDVGLAEAFRVLKQGGHFVAWITEFEGTRPYDPYSTATDIAVRYGAPIPYRSRLVPALNVKNGVHKNGDPSLRVAIQLFVHELRKAGRFTESFWLAAIPMAASVHLNRAWPRSLHVGNVANVAYGYAKILTTCGASVKLICHDVTHLMS